MSRINIDDPKFFDWWREHYNDLTHEENIEIGTLLEAKYPGQASFSFSVFNDFFRQHKGVRVLEVGGWKGELAYEMMIHHNISSWHNIDMCKAAVDKTVPMGALPYRATFPSKFDWFKDPRTEDYDVCVSAHTIEHLSDEHLISLMAHIAGIPNILFEAPIGMESGNWDGYMGTHILKMGWNTINAMMTGHGYSYTRLNDWCYHYRKV